MILIQKHFICAPAALMLALHTQDVGRPNVHCDWQSEHKSYQRSNGRHYIERHHSSLSICHLTDKRYYIRIRYRALVTATASVRPRTIVDYYIFNI